MRLCSHLVPFEQRCRDCFEEGLAREVTRKQLQLVESSAVESKKAKVASDAIIAYGAEPIKGNGRFFLRKY